MKGGNSMKKRIKLADRLLPDYTKNEEILNMVTHIVGGALGLLSLTLCIIRCAASRNVPGLVGSAIFGFTMVALYCISSIYHGLHEGIGKKVMQVIDHCAIYFLICGTYTPILLSAFLPVYPVLCWGLLGFQWALAFLAATLNAIDLKKHKIFSMICYILMGWSIILFPVPLIQVMTLHGFWLLLSGGIAYTIGAILYGIGSHRRWFHGVFHIFVVLGSILHFLSIYFYAL